MQAQPVLPKLMLYTCKDMHKTRRNALAVNVLAAMVGRRLTGTDLGRSIPATRSHKHRIQRADRWLSNPHLHQENVAIQRSLADQLIAPHHTRPVILMDWSDREEYKQHFVLRAAIALDGRSLPLYAEVQPIETKEKLRTHESFLGRVSAIVAAGCCPLLVTDAGFRTTWFPLVKALGGDRVGRVRNRH